MANWQLNLQLENDSSLATVLSYMASVLKARGSREVGRLLDQNDRIQMPDGTLIARVQFEFLGKPATFTADDEAWLQSLDSAFK